ncbi:MAG: glutamate 5-kinase [Methanophagales archaeon]|nr:glutamate 5-kinase [Methanophagales archaeon]MCW7072378.1 glutamate 5-kinase [Methanophagales archaeon]
MDEDIAVAKAKRIVIKVGTSTLTDDNHRLAPDKVKKLAREIVELRRRGKEVILVSSGAIGAGIGKLNLKQRPRDIKLLQATAAVGQSILMSTYDRYFSAYGQTIAQLLLTHADFLSRQRYLNLRNTLLTLLKSGVIPIVNENDTTAVDEIKVGDNDNLSALVASNLEADLLIILTDTDGLFTRDPRRSERAELIPVVRDITPEIERIADTGEKTKTSSVGGMRTKIQAAKLAMNAGIPVVIANGAEEDILLRIVEGEPVGTRFLPRKSDRMNDREHWIRFVSPPRGRIKVDEGAKAALVAKGSSLLPSGIIGVEGVFMPGDTVSIIDSHNIEFARGITNYSSVEIEKIKGLHTSDIERVLGHKEYDEVVYRGNLYLIQEQDEEGDVRREDSTQDRLSWNQLSRFPDSA